MDAQEREESDQEPTDGEDFVVTPSRSRVSSAHPPSDSIDVFGGSSFNWHSATCDDEDATEEEGGEQDRREDQDDMRTERDEDKDRDFIGTDAEKHGRSRGRSVLARGVVDLYRFSDVQKSVLPKGVGPGARGDPRAQSAATNNNPNSPGPMVEQRRWRNGIPHISHIHKTSSHTKSPPYTPMRPFPSPDASSNGSTMRSLHTARTTPGRSSRS